MGIKNRVIVCCFIVGTFSAAAAYAGHTYHSWTKISEEQGYNGQVLCKWHCSGVYGKESHYKETHGYGRCSQP